MYLYILLLILHLIIVLITWLLRKLHILKCHYIAIFIELMLPVFGFVMMLRQSVRYAGEQKKNAEVELAKLEADEISRSAKLDDDDNEAVPLNEALVVNDYDTRRDLMKDVLFDINANIQENDDDIDQIVPISEALILNDSATKRALIMDVLYTNPSEYVVQLTDAKTNDDTEVVHYAVTALVELQKEYDIKFQKLIRERQEDPDDVTLKVAYQRLLEQYISSGMLEGSALEAQLYNYRDILEERLKDSPDNWSLWYKKTDTDLKLKDAEAMSHDVEEMLTRWQDRESVYLFKIQCCALKHDRQGILDAVHEINRQQIHLSQTGREIVEFWTE